MQQSVMTFCTPQASNVTVPVRLVVDVDIVAWVASAVRESAANYSHICIGKANRTARSSTIVGHEA